MDAIIKTIFTEKVTYSKERGYIMAHMEEMPHIVAEIRGWGWFKNILATDEEIIDLQDNLGQFIADAINEKMERDKYVIIK